MDKSLMFNTNARHSGKGRIWDLSSSNLGEQGLMMSASNNFLDHGKDSSDQQKIITKQKNNYYNK